MLDLVGKSFIVALLRRCPLRGEGIVFFFYINGSHKWEKQRTLTARGGAGSYKKVILY